MRTRRREFQASSFHLEMLIQQPWSGMCTPDVSHVQPRRLRVARIDARHVDLMDFGVPDVLRDVVDQGAQPQRFRTTSSRVLRRGLSYDELAGKLPVDVGVEISWRFPARYAGVLLRQLLTRC